METIKEFFKSKTVRVVAWVMLALSAIALIIGGATTEVISSAVVLVGAVITAIGALVAFIAEQISKK